MSSELNDDSNHIDDAWHRFFDDASMVLPDDFDTGDDPPPPDVRTSRHRLGAESSPEDESSG